MDRIVEHRGEIWTGDWFFSEDLKADRFDLRLHHTQHGDIHIVEINHYDEGKRYVVETHNQDAPVCTITNIHGDLPVPVFSSYTYVGQKHVQGYLCDSWELKTNATTFHYYDQSANQEPVSFESVHTEGEKQTTSFWEFKEGPQKADNFNITKVAPNVQCKQVAAKKPPHDHHVFGAPLPLLACEQMKAIARAHFPKEYQTDMICISWYESSWRPDVYNGICCYGLWQINRNHLGEPGCPHTESELYDANTNAQCAKRVLDTQGLKAWTTWDSGDCSHWSKCVV
jgi:hypothetical protein